MILPGLRAGSKADLRRMNPGAARTVLPWPALGVETVVEMIGDSDMPRADIEKQNTNPVDVVERLAAVNEWSFARASDDEVTLVVTGRWTDYQVSFTWMPEIEALHLACAFDLRVPERCRPEMTELAALVNEQLWVGHFDVWFKDGIIMFRHALVLTGGVEAADAQCEALLGIALNACERHYQAFQFVLWAGKNPREALESSLFETRGEA
jgi:hypothetical protein